MTYDDNYQPDWSEAPPWAKYWAIDKPEADGFTEFGWYQEEPTLQPVYEFWMRKDSTEQVEYDYIGKYTGTARLVKRPKDR